MLGTVLHGGGQRDKGCLLHIAGGDDIGHLGFAFGDGAGLIQDHGIQEMSSLQAFGAFDEDAVFRTLAGAHHDGNGGGQPQRTGAGDDQHRDAHVQGKVKPGAQQQPHHNGDGGDSHNGGNKDRSHLVRQFGNGGLGGGGLLHQPDDLGQGGIISHAGGPEFEEAALVDRGGDHPVVHLFLHRDALAGEGRLIHRGAAFDDNAVHRDALSRADHNDVPGDDLFHRDLHFGAAAEHHGALGGQIHQLGDGFGGPALGAGFQPFAEGDEGEDGGCRFKVEVHRVFHQQVMVHRHHGKRDLVDDIDAVHQRRSGTHGDEGIHVGRPMPQRFEPGEEIVAVQVQNGQRQQQLGEGEGQRIVHAVHPLGHRQPEHAAHRDVKQRHQEDQRVQELPFFGLGLLQRQVDRGFRPGGGALGGIGRGGAVSGVLHYPGDVRRGERAFIVVYHHAVGQQVDIHRFDPFRLGQRLFDVRGTGGAGHAGNIELFGHGITSSI